MHACLDVTVLTTKVYRVIRWMIFVALMVEVNVLDSLVTFRSRRHLYVVFSDASFVSLSLLCPEGTGSSSIGGGQAPSTFPCGTFFCTSHPCWRLYGVGVLSFIPTQ